MRDREMFKDFSFHFDAALGRFVLSYQSLDKFGNEVGKRTHQESETLDGLFRKAAESHSQAAAAVERMQRKLSNLEVKQEKQKQ
jgi:hypothetical protein